MGNIIENHTTPMFKLAGLPGSQAKRPDQPLKKAKSHRKKPNTR